jgi:hypothetical protein
MAKTIAEVERKNFNNPDEVRTFPKGKVELVKVGGGLVGKGTFEPGWKWSTCVKALAKTDSCVAPHYQYQLSGKLKVKMDDGTEITTVAGDVATIGVGHDAWVEGSEPVVVIDFQGMVDYAKSK